jgi:hypothetical protein
MNKKDRKKGKKRGFYGHVLGESEKLDFAEAVTMEGLDEEIAILRLKLRQLLESEPEKFELSLKVANTIARLVGIRYNMLKDKRQPLREAITKVLTDIAVPLGIKILLK